MQPPLTFTLPHPLPLSIPTPLQPHLPFFTASTKRPSPPPPPSFPRRTLLKTLPILLSLPIHATLAQTISSPSSSPPSETTQPPLSDIDPLTDEPEITQKVYLDLATDNSPSQRVIIGLYGTIAPATVANFVSLIRQGYAGTKIYRVVPGLTVQMGDVLGNGGKSGRAAVAGGVMDVENFRVKHSMVGLVNMVGTGGKVDSRFFVNTRRGDSGYLDGRYCAFGRVVDGMEVWWGIEAMVGGGVLRRMPKVIIVDCGVLG